MDDKKEHISNYYQPSAEEEKMRSLVYTRKDEMEQGRDYQRVSKNFKKWRDQWESNRPDKEDDEWQSNHIVPITFSVIESALTDYSEQQSQPLILGRGREDQPRATIMSRLYEYTWEVTDGDLALMDTARECLIMGTAIVQEYFLKSTRKVKKPNKDKKKQTYETEEVVEYDDCVMELVPLEDFRVDENARSFYGAFAAKDCMRSYTWSYDAAKNFFKGDWDPFNNFQYVKAGAPTEYYEYFKPGSDLGNQVEIWWYWQRIPEDWLVIVANDVVLFMGPNPYRHKQLPFGRVVDVGRPHCFYGKGECEILESTQDEKNTFRRMMIDRGHLDIDKSFAIGSRIQLNEEELTVRPHAILEVEDVTQIKPIEYNDVPRSTELTMNQLTEDSVIATGIDPRFTSAPQAGTATQAAILKETALKRIKMKITNMQKQLLVPIARLRVANICQYYSQPKLEKIVGDKSTQTYKMQVEMLKQKGLLVTKNNVDYQKKYRNIRLENKKIDFNERGVPYETPYKGYSFFEALPQYFLPLSEEGFDIKFKAGATLAVSKPLQQTKDQEMYDRLIANPAFDPLKLGEMLCISNDKDPDDLVLKTPDTQQNDEDMLLKSQMELAMMENRDMSRGKEIPATAYATPAHSQMHIEFLKSENVKDPKIIELFTNHIVPELIAQDARAGGNLGQQNQMPGMGASPANDSNSQNSQVQSGESLRRGVTPGKNKKMTMADVLPGRVTGSRDMPAHT